MSLKRIVSGGQTGVDRAALDAAIERNMPHGGWCPRGRLAEDGSIPSRYSLRETPSDRYAERTEQNVVDSDATLILAFGDLDAGSKLTLELAEKHCRPRLLIQLTPGKHEPETAIALVHRWLRDAKVEALNVAGPRESKSPGVYQAAKAFLLDLIGAVQRAD